MGGSFMTDSNATDVETGSAGALNADAITAVDVSDYQCSYLQVLGAFVGTLTFQGSNDNSTFVSVLAIDISSSTRTPITFFTAPGIFYLPTPFRYFRLRMTAYTSGTASATAFFQRVPSGDLARRNNGITGDTDSTLIGNVGDSLKVTALLNEKISTVNSSTANLASAATFTGTAEDMLGYASVQVNFKADQAATIQVQQSTDSTNWDISDSYTVSANTGDSRAFKANARYVRVLVTNNGGSTTTVLRLQTILCPVGEAQPRALTQNGEFKVYDTNNNGGLNADLTVGTSSVEGKVGSARLVNRKYVVVEALDTNVYMGFSSAVTSSNGIPIFKNQILILPIGDNTQIWFIADVSSKHVRFGELA